VQDDQPNREQRVLRGRFTADPASVPGARRFVADGLRAWGHESLVDDATLCVSELAGNAALHGSSSYIEVCVLDLERSVRLCVEDDGPAPAAAVAPRTTLPGLDEAFDDELDELDRLLSAPATGRGLAIVSVLARDWGVEQLRDGKRVWADLSPAESHGSTAGGSRGGSAQSSAQNSTGSSTAGFPVTPFPDGSTDAVGVPESAGTETPEGWCVVRLQGCPVELSLRQDQHLDELVRELTLMTVDNGNPASAALAERLEAILRAPAHARVVARQQAQEAHARGEVLVDAEMAMPREFSTEVRRLHEAVLEADVLCEQRRLLTLASPPDIRDFRAWMTEEVVAQVEQGAEPVPWKDWLGRD
jgi:anti-sigma regulatory factor (Ser/Thr protein kinase)